MNFRNTRIYGGLFAKTLVLMYNGLFFNRFCEISRVSIS